MIIWLLDARMVGVSANAADENIKQVTGENNIKERKAQF
jgi:hypothetical protein